MPFVCIKTGEMAPAGGLEDPNVSVETSPRSLCSRSVVKGKSSNTGSSERWVWKEEAELTPQELAQWKEMEAATRSK